MCMISERKMSVYMGKTGRQGTGRLSGRTRGNLVDDLLKIKISVSILVLEFLIYSLPFTMDLV